MKSFQNSKKVTRKSNSSKNLGKKINEEKLTSHLQQSFSHRKVREKQFMEDKEINHFPEASFDSQLKEIVKMNEDYFRTKMKISENPRPNPLKLKIPSTTGKTIYKKDYQQKKLKFHQCSKSQDYCPSNTLEAPFFGLTTYESQFLQYPQNRRKKKKSAPLTIDEASPLSSLTQYNSNFQNWEVKNGLPLMKPFIKCSATNLPFQGNSLYKKDFSGLQNRQYSPMRNSSKQKFDQRRVKRTSEPLFMTTTNQKQFKSKKPLSKNVNFKPKNRTVNNGGYFKGKTEYQGEFVSMRKGRHEQKNYQTLEDIQNLIVNL